MVSSKSELCVSLGLSYLVSLKSELLDSRTELRGSLIYELRGSQTELRGL